MEKTLIQKILDDKCTDFICNQYDEFKQGWHLPYSENVSQALMFDEYVRQLPDEDIAEWFDVEVTQADIDDIRLTVSEGTDAYLTLNHKNIFGYCHA